MDERTFDDFDEFAGDYRSIHTNNLTLTGADSFYYAAHKVQQLKQKEKNNPLALLDIGCGDGVTEIFFNREFPSWQLNGIDVSKQSIAIAQQRNITSAVFKLYDGKNVPFERESIDIVFMAAVLHHIDFSLHQQVLKGVYRVLKPGGRFYLFEHNPLNPFTRHLVKTCPFDKDARLLKSGYAQSILTKQNFKNIESQFILFFPRKGLLSKLIWLEEKLKWLPLGGQYFFSAIK